jgi:hypothetical protein
MSNTDTDWSQRVDWKHHYCLGEGARERGGGGGVCWGWGETGVRGKERGEVERRAVTY